MPETILRASRVHRANRACGRLAAVLAVAALAALGCRRASEAGTTEATPSEAKGSSASATAPASASASPSAPPLSARISRPAAARVVAIGDLHGDLDHARRAFALAGAVGPDGHWSGGSLVVVQTGDEIDRGDDDRAILDQVDVWKREAKAAGGELVALDGNHELMNVALDFRYVTKGGFASFAPLASGPGAGASLPANLPSEARGRAIAFMPGGAYAKILAERPLYVIVGDTLFVHGGVMPATVDYGLARLDDGVRAWLIGDAPEPPKLATSEDGPVWTRAFSDPGHEDCQDLLRVLSRLGLRQMVVGHTVQKSGITSACGEHVWRIDVGLSRAYGGDIAALEITPGKIRSLTETAAVHH